MDGRLSADAAPLRRRLRESLYGDVPMVVPAVSDRTYSCQYFVRHSHCRRTLWNV